ncbi:MAG: hypothetical protein QMD12_02725 [Candidatus Aenigmarchaeota archaeon]|nr:hypothetical protein [Candidatus Aenigmarchaeota archaeon]
MDRKGGLKLPFKAVIAGLFVLIVFAVIYLIFVAKYFELHVWIEENEAEIHAINLAQVLLSSDLTYSDEFTSHRAIFDKSKLDAGRLQGLDIWYPDAIATVGIQDLETGETWSAHLVPNSIRGTTASEILNCLSNTIKIEPGMIFRLPPGLWEWPDLKKCFGEVNQRVLSVRDFPVAIRVSDNEIHRGRMVISLRELIF